MVKHIILWTLKPELQKEERLQAIREIKQGLEDLKGRVPGLVDIRVYGGEETLPTSNCDVMLDATLESFEALKAYAVHPAHVAVADNRVRPFAVQRTCLDFTV